MKTIKQVISLILLLAFSASTVFNILFLFKKIDRIFLYAQFASLLFIVFLISVLGIILKNIRKDEYVTVNIIAPAKELGILYTGILVIWAVTYFLAVIFR